jgi:hypothetical protein
MAVVLATFTARAIRVTVTMSVCGCLVVDVLIPFLENNGRRKHSPRSLALFTSLPPPSQSWPKSRGSFVLYNSNALQRQRVKSTQTPRPTHSTPMTPTVLKSLPEHKPLLPLLLSHDVPPRLAKACADKYDIHANELRSKTETKLAPYLLRHSGGQPAGIYSVFLENYSKALRDWAQSVLNVALRRLKRESVQLWNWEATYCAPLWLPVRILGFKLPHRG